MFVRIALCALLLYAAAGAEIIDRVAVSLSRQTITLSEIDLEVRLTAFENRQPLDLTPAQRREAAGRLVDQALIRREMDVSHYPLPKPADAGDLVHQVEASYSSRAEFEGALAKYGLSLDDLSRHLWFELATVQFVDYRFRPGIEIPEDELKDYYNRKVEEWRQKGVQPIPSFEESRATIDEVLLKERANRALSLWLGEERALTDIVYHEAAFK